MNKEKMLLNYDSPRISKDEVFLEHVIAGNGSGSNADNYETPNGHEAMPEGDYYGDGEGDDWV